jgi:aryl-alcohol dehydrogenase-like predicted oxidoreductase
MAQKLDDYRLLGRSGLRVSPLSLGTMTFRTGSEWGSSDAEAQAIYDAYVEAGGNFVDTANFYGQGGSEVLTGELIKSRREQIVLSTKYSLTMRWGDPNGSGNQRKNMVRSVEASLKRLGTDYIDVYHMHGFDAVTPIEETLQTLNGLVQSGKVRYIACSNFSGWHLMKSLAISEKYGWVKYVAHQAYYSLIGRDFEWELMPLGIEQKVGTIVWSPLGWGRLTGKLRRGHPLPETSRLHKTAEQGPPVDDEYMYRVVDALDEVAKETGKTVPVVALNWLLQRPTVSNIVIGARNEQQLKQNLDAVGWNLTAEQVAKLDKASETTPVYPYWHQRQFPQLNPTPVKYYDR